MFSQRSREGEVLIDHSASPGVSEEFIHVNNLDVPAVVKGAVYEAPTVTCSHCQAIVIVNPNRQRAREYCGKCHHYICDRCAGVMKRTLECRPIAKIFDEIIDRHERNGSGTSIILATK